MMGLSGTPIEPAAFETGLKTGTSGKVAHLLVETTQSAIKIAEAFKLNVSLEWDQC